MLSDGAAEVRGTVRLTVSNVEDAPNARDNKYTTLRNRKLCVVAPGVLGNDRDLDREPLHARLDETAHNGRVALHADGSFCYRPNSGFVGKDRFTYWAIDPQGKKDQGSVTIKVVKP